MNLILALLVFLIVYIIIQVVRIRSDFQNVFQWWNNYNGDQYNNVVNLFGILASYQSTIIYYLTKVTGNLFSSLSRSQIEFFADTILPHLRDDTNPNLNPETNFMMPRHVARDIRFRQGDDPLFDQWLANHVLDDSIELQVDDKGNYTNRGVYPSPSNIPAWKAKFKEWGMEYTVEHDKVLYPHVTEETLTEWLDVQKHPDNFLARYRIAPDSPLAIFFVNDFYNNPQTAFLFDPSAFGRLLGQGNISNSGGWIGFLFGLEGYTRDQYQNLLYTRLVPPPVPSSDKSKQDHAPPPLKSNSCRNLGSVGSAIVSGAESAIPIVTMAAFLGPLGIVAVGGTILAGLGIGVVQGYLQYQSCQ